MKKILSETTRHTALIFGMENQLMNLAKFVQIISVGQKMACPRYHVFYIGLYWENMKKSK